MGFWPFGAGKRQRVTETKHVREQSDLSGPSDNMGRLEKVSTDMSADARPSAKAGAKGKPQRPSKARAPYEETLPKPQTAPGVVPGARRLSRNAPQLSEKALYQQNPVSQSSLGPENFNVVRQAPTLHARRPEQDSSIGRRKSSKRKAEDYAREREVRAMSSSPIPIPRRPTSFYDSPLQREVREIPGGLDRKLHRPSSQVSLPILEPWPNFENRPYQNSFKIGMFAALSPRPTIKYDGRSQNARGKQPLRPNPLNNPAIAEESGDLDKRRINELADDLDASGLRELMERDRRRRERKKQQDQAKLQRRLQRRAEKQREEEARKARTEEYVSASASRIRGLGIDQRGEEADVAESSGYRKGAAANPFADQQSQPASASAIRNPFDDEKEDADVMQDPGSDRERGPVVPTRSPLRKIRTDKTKDDAKPSQATLSPPTSPAPRPADRQSMSQGSFLNRELTGDVPESASLTGAASDHSSQRVSSWTAFFKRGTRRKLSSSFQGRSTPSEFSNTSRESFARKQPPPVVTPRTFRRVDSATPQRTRSKFREDLPELPISPPDSRMQSPETTVAPATSLLTQAVTELPRGTAEETDISAFTPSSPIPTGEGRQENQPPMDIDVATTAKPEVILSQSLASVDSEGSWLSGKPLNRRSGASQPLKGSGSSLTRPIPGASDGGNDVPPSPGAERIDRPTGTYGNTEADETWHAGVGRQPTFVPQASRAKSTEGLLNEYTTKERQDSSPDDEDSDGDESPEQGDLEVTLMRARSVEYKGNARRISAGSAKLLDIKRSSMQSGELLSQPAQVQASSSEAQAPKEDTSAS